jgi:hypothetical protein
MGKTSQMNRKDSGGHFFCLDRGVRPPWGIGLYEGNYDTPKIFPK